MSLECDGVVGKKPGSASEFVGDRFHGEVQIEGVQDIGEDERNVGGQGLRDHGGQRGECIVSTDHDAAIGEGENNSDGVDVLLVLCHNAPFLEFILLDAASVGQSRGVEDTNLGKRLHTPYTFKSSSTYHYSILARKFIQAGGIGLTLAVRTTLFNGAVQDIEVVVIPVRTLTINSKSEDSQRQSQGWYIAYSPRFWMF